MKQEEVMTLYHGSSLSLGYVGNERLTKIQFISKREGSDKLNRHIGKRGDMQNKYKSNN